MFIFNKGREQKAENGCLFIVATSGRKTRRSCERHIACPLPISRVLDEVRIERGQGYAHLSSPCQDVVLQIIDSALSSASSRKRVCQVSSQQVPTLAGAYQHEIPRVHCCNSLIVGSCQNVFISARPVLNSMVTSPSDNRSQSHSVSSQTATKNFKSYPTMRLGNQSPLYWPSLLTPISTENPKPLSLLKINSLEARMLTVTAHNRQKVQIKISHGKGYTKQRPGEQPNMEPLVFNPWAKIILFFLHRGMKIHIACCQPGKLSRSWVSRIIIGTLPQKHSYSLLGFGQVRIVPPKFMC